MSLAELLTSPASRLITATLVHFLWQGAAVAGLLILIVELLGIRRPALRYNGSLAALVLMTLCPIATLTCLSFEGPISAPANLNRISAPIDNWHSTLLGTSAGHSPLARLAALQPYLLALWLTGVVLLGARLLGGIAGVIHLRRTRLALPHEMAEIVERLGQRLRMDALPLVFLSRQVAEAMAVGVVRPLVLIPAAWATEMPLPMLEAVIAHELAHLRRRDLWINLLQRIIETLLFYHPAVWWLSRRLRIERELCADELAVAATGQRLVYAQALEQVAHWRRAEVGPLLAAFLRGEQDMRLLERVRSVLGSATGERSRFWPAGILALALPLALWAASLGLIGTTSGVALADDDDRPAKVRRDREEEERSTKRKPREARQEVIEEKIIRKKPTGDDKVEEKIKSSGDDARLAELTVLVKRLVERVERLQAELNEIRGDKKRGTSEEEEVEIRERKRSRQQPEQQAQGAQAKAIAQAKQAEQRARRQAEQRKREAVEREEEAQERAIEQKLEAIEREKEAKERAAERKRDDDRASDNIKRKFTELAELKRLEALKVFDIDKQAWIEKIQAQAQEAAKQAVDAGKFAAKAKAQALDAVKRALAEKEFIELKKNDKEDAKPAKNKPANKDDES